MVRARCRDIDPEVFFFRGAKQSRRALRVCERCCVRQECLSYAIAHQIEFGVWGGLTERQRRRLLRLYPTSSEAVAAAAS
ncbi:MAG: WhiB family transcriptional regulator [Actinobacteria bacterium]|nr:WhiB family transcriptional regulator [Actinomycetota bacterium]